MSKNKSNNKTEDDIQQLKFKQIDETYEIFEILFKTLMKKKAMIEEGPKNLIESMFGNNEKDIISFHIRLFETSGSVITLNKNEINNPLFSQLNILNEKKTSLEEKVNEMKKEMKKQIDEMSKGIKIITERKEIICKKMNELKNSGEKYENLSLILNKTLEMKNSPTDSKDHFDKDFCLLIKMLSELMKDIEGAIHFIDIKVKEMNEKMILSYNQYISEFNSIWNSLSKETKKSSKGKDNNHEMKMCTDLEHSVFINCIQSTRLPTIKYFNPTKK